MNGLNTILYLESFVDSTASLPPDLQRQLNTIKALDERCIELSDTVQLNVTQLMQMPPQHQQGPTEEYIQLSRRVENDQRLLLQFAEEKVQVAQQVYDLLEMHAIELEKQIDDFESDLRVSGVIDNSMEYYNAPSFMPLDSMRGRTPKIEEWSSLAAPTENLSMPLPPMPSIKRSASHVGQKGPTGQKRPREETVEAVPPAPAAVPAPAAAVPPAVVAVPAVAAVVPLAGATGPVGPKKQRIKSEPKSVQSSGSLLNSGASLDDGTFERTGVEQDVVEQTLPLVGFINPPPPGLQPQAPRPQAVGQYLLQDGIVEELRGRHAELFWPPDSMWYLIEIQEVNVDTKMARIMYTTGEVEELDLNEIARDMHMSIISLDA